MGNKRPPLSAALTAVILFLVCGCPTWAAVEEELIDELTGAVPNPARKIDDLETIYVRAFDSLKLRLAGKLEDVRTSSEEALRRMAVHAGKPGNEAQSKVFCAAVTRQLKDKTYPAAARHILIRALGDVGGAEAVPGLVALLGGEDAIEKDLARMSIQNIPGADSDKALIDALQTAAGDKVLTLGLIDSIAARRPATAATVIVPLLKSEETETASAAASALGRIGGAEATKALGSALREAHSATGDPKTQEILENALLGIANQRGRAAGSPPRPG